VGDAVGALDSVVLRESGRDREAVEGTRDLIERYAPGSQTHVRRTVASVLMAESELAEDLGDQLRTTGAFFSVSCSSLTAGQFCFRHLGRH
jgi:hypothetical protein